METQRREHTEICTTLATVEERLRVREIELQQSRATLAAVETRYGDMAKATDALRNELRMALAVQNRPQVQPLGPLKIESDTPPESE